MNLINTEDVASMILFDLRASEGELQYLAIALNQVLTKLPDKELHALFTNHDPDIAPDETREFIEDMHQYLVSMLGEHSYPEYLVPALKSQNNEASDFNFSDIKRPSEPSRQKVYS